MLILLAMPTLAYSQTNRHNSSLPSYPRFNTEFRFDFLHPTTGPEKTVLFMGASLTLIEWRRINFGGIGLAMAMKKMSPGYPYPTEPQQVEVHPLIITPVLGYRLFPGDDYWLGINVAYDPIRRSKMLTLGLSVNPAS